MTFKGWDMADAHAAARSRVLEDWGVPPRDWGPHRGRSEWWYFAGRLTDASGTAHAYMVSFFRSSYLVEIGRFAHLLLDSPYAGARIACERTVSPLGRRSRIASDTLAIDYDGWSATLAGDHINISASYHDSNIKLNLSAAHPLVVGNEGRIELGSVRTTVSSWPKLATEGELTVAGKTYRVSGVSWHDHERGTIRLPHHWHWWGINFDNGTDLMVRHTKNQGVAHLRHPDGTSQRTTTVVVTPTRYWNVSRGSRYPVAWTIRLPELQTELDVSPDRDDCETPFPVAYWEGLCHAKGKIHGETIVTGGGYMELVGCRSQMLRFLVSRLGRAVKDGVFPNHRTDHGTPLPGMNAN